MSTVAPFVAICLTNCGKVIYTQFRKTQYRLDRHIILGRIMYDIHYTLMYNAEWMVHYTRTCNTDLEEYIALERTMRIFRNALHSDVQCGFFRNTLHSDIQCGFLKECIALGRTMRIFRNTLHSNVQCGFLKECIALERTMWIFKGMHCTRTYNADF